MSSITFGFLKIKMSHIHFMQRCLDLAILSAGNVSPNPMVGAVLVYDNRIIGEGYHQQYGESHAEVNCIDSVLPEHMSLISKSTLYVSLEPCSHTGKTPPCADFIIKHQIPKVVIACRDFSSKVNGKGIALLQDHGIEVTENILEKEATELNRRFFTSQLKSRPFIILKWAQSNDGLIGKEGESIKISNGISNKLVHKWRSEEDAIWVGFQTAKTDNPILNVRHWKGRNPIRIIYDKSNALLNESNLFDGKQKTMYFNHSVATVSDNLNKIIVSPVNTIASILAYLHEADITSIMIEGGAKLHQQLIELNLWDEIRMIQSNDFLHTGIKAIDIPINSVLTETFNLSDNQVFIFKNTKA